MGRRTVFGWGLPAFVGGLLFFQGGPQQEAVLRGRVLDAVGEPVAGLEVSLHHVAPDGGDELARATTDRDGRFSIPVRQPAGEGIFFASARYEDQLYIGEPFRGPVPPQGEYVLVVGAAGAFTAGDGAAAARNASEPRVARRGRIAFGLGLLALASIALVALVARTRRARRGPVGWRAALIELAALEEQDMAPTRAAQEHRNELRRRVRDLARAGHDAAGV